MVHNKPTARVRKVIDGQGALSHTKLRRATFVVIVVIVVVEPLRLPQGQSSPSASTPSSVMQMTRDSVYGTLFCHGQRQGAGIVPLAGTDRG